ncbi:MAG: hypothetical protein GY953_51330 [bacterium]|nr:hypothetical protein [bacterium]
MSAAAVHQVFDRIKRMSAEDRILLDRLLARLGEEEWRREAESARRMARERGVDQEAIDRAVDRIRYAS